MPPRGLADLGGQRGELALQARSQLIGGMTVGLSMALFEESAMDPQFGDYPNHDLAGYHATGIRVRDLPIRLDKLLS